MNDRHLPMPTFSHFTPVAAAAVVAGLLLAAPTPAAAAPHFIRLGIGVDGATSVSISWNTDGETESIVEWGTRPGELTETLTGTSSRAPGALNVIHEAWLEGLEPETTYYYSVGSDAEGFSAERSFTTGPEVDENCASFSFGYIGDNRPDETFGGGENYPEVLGQLDAHDPSFVLNGGDMVVDGDQVDQWVDFLGWTSEAGGDLPHMPTIGNHDDGPGEGDGAIYNQVWALPRATGENGSGTEDYYYFTYGNAIFVSLSTDTFTGGATPFAEQAAWLDRVLTENPRRWKIVLAHKPIYTHEVVFSISHQPDEEGQNAAYVDVFDRHHVDLVLTSHNHWYERFEPSACGTAGNPGSDDACSVGASNFGDGTVYVVSGGAGAFTIPAVLCGGGILDPAPGRVACDDPHHYLLLTIDDGTLSIEAHDVDAGGVFDSLTITKSDGVECAPDVVDPEPEPDAGDTPDADGPDAGSEEDATDEDVVEEDVADDEVTEPPAPDADEPDAPGADTAPEQETGSTGEGSGDETDATGPRREVPDTSDRSEGCSCRSVPGQSGSLPVPGFTLVLAALLGFRRRRTG